MRRIAYWSLALFLGAIPLQMAFYEMQAYSGSIPRLVGIVALIVTMATIIFEGRIRPIGRIHVAALLFMVWSALTFMWSENPDSTWQRSITYAQIAVMVWIIAQFAQTQEEQLNLILAFVIGCFIPIIAVVTNLMSGVALGGLSVYSMKHARFGAFNEDPNELALGLAIGIPLAWYTFVVRRGLPRFIGLIYIPLAVIVIGLTGSRGGALSAVIGMSIILFTFKKLDKISRLTAIGSVMVGIVAASFVLPESTIERLGLLFDFLESRQTYARTSLGEADVRWEIWSQGLQIFSENPVFGVGSGAFADASEPIGGNRWSGHSAWIQPLTETGAIGFIFWISTVGLCFWTAFTLRGTERTLWIITLLTWGLGSTFLGNEYNKDTWMVLGLVAARAVDVTRRRRLSRRRIIPMMRQPSTSHVVPNSRLVPAPR